MLSEDSLLPTYTDVLMAAARIAPHAHVTPVLRSRRLDAQAGCRMFFKAEHLQRSGAFKFRGACNAVWSLSDAAAALGVVTHSSGNHGAALALAAGTRDIPCHVVVPDGAVEAKRMAIAAYGATLHFCAPTMAAREAACAALQIQTGANMVHPYVDSQVIAGQGTAALELLQGQALDALVVPIGGGGLAAGTAITLSAISPGTRLFVAEPTGAADTFASLRQHRRITDIVPNTFCDGLRGTIGAPNLTALRAYGAKALLVDDRQTMSAMRLLWRYTKQTVEPSSAIALAAVLRYGELFSGQTVGVMLSGGNVDLDLVATLFSATE